MAQYCPRCHNIVPGSYKVCNVCGYSGEMSDRQNGKPVIRVKVYPRNILIVVVIIAILIAGGYFIRQVSSNRPKDEVSAYSSAYSHPDAADFESDISGITYANENEAKAVSMFVDFILGLETGDNLVGNYYADTDVYVHDYTTSLGWLYDNLMKVVVTNLEVENGYYTVTATLQEKNGDSYTDKYRIDTTLDSSYKIVGSIVNPL